ncbi:MAG: hypothetical protein COV44_04990 [Deltaproteobacteria bacterium CG11_big_fil_rev_8_21_14_0_20_45_16]|nr:MAG: hypothetical protein COV44_04990 [Deltaproteobacteria bacterium CG11_big_fil_rev_8_21_14_0_20_45_16]
MSLRFNEADLIEFAKTVELIASKILDGLHESRRGGEGLEFHSSLPYAEGEDVRRIDWKRMASSDRVYVRKFDREEKTAWSILLDSSPSMAYGEKKLQSRLWVAVIGFLAKCWGDKFRVLPEDYQPLDEVFEGLLQSKLGIPPEAFDQIEPEPESRLLVISDFFQDSSFLENCLETWHEHYKEIHFIQILDPKEKFFDFKDVIRFEDMESSARLVLDSGVVKKRYQAEFEHHQNEVRRLLSQNGVFFESVSGMQAIELQIQGFFESL